MSFESQNYAPSVEIHKTGFYEDYDTLNSENKLGVETEVCRKAFEFVTKGDEVGYQVFQRQVKHMETTRTAYYKGELEDVSPEEITKIKEEYETALAAKGVIESLYGKANATEDKLTQHISGPIAKGTAFDTFT